MSEPARSSGGLRAVFIAALDHLSRPDADPVVVIDNVRAALLVYENGLRDA